MVYYMCICASCLGSGSLLLSGRQLGTVFVLLVAEVLIHSLADNSTKCSSVKLAILVPGR